MDETITELKKKLEELGAKGAGVKYPRALVTTAVETARRLQAAGLSRRQAAMKLGLRDITLKRWLARTNEDAATAGFKPVRVVDHASGQLTLEAPSGWRVTGLDVATLVEVMRRLS